LYLVAGLSAAQKNHLDLNIEEKADYMLDFKCGKHCLSNLYGRVEAKEGLVKILQEMQSLSPKEKQNFVRDRVRQSISFPSNQGYAKCNWLIGEAPGVRFENVCKQCFENVYQIGHTSIQSMISEIREGVTGHTILKLNDHTTVEKTTRKRIVATATRDGLQFSRKQAAMLAIKNNPKDQMCYSW